MANISTLLALHDVLQRERSATGLARVLALVEVLHFNLDDLQRVPIGAEVRRLSRSEAVTPEVRALAQRCKAQWQALLRSGAYPPIEGDTRAGEGEEGGGRRGASRRELATSMTALNRSASELASELEPILYERAAAVPGRSTAKFERYTELVRSAKAAVSRQCCPLT